MAECDRRAGLNLESSVESLDVLKHSDMTRLEHWETPSGQSLPLQRLKALELQASLEAWVLGLYRKQ